MAFLDQRPVFYGHSLLIPKSHAATVYELSKEQINSLFIGTQKVGRAIEAGMQAQGSFIATNNKVSQSVPHCHIHIIPRNKGDGLKGFFWPRQKYENELQIVSIQNAIKSHLI